MVEETVDDIHGVSDDVQVVGYLMDHCWRAAAEDGLGPRSPNDEDDMMVPVTVKWNLMIMRNAKNSMITLAGRPR